MSDSAPELLHLLKAGRILQYRQQNVAMVSAAEGTEFEIAYAERWLEPETEVAVGDGAIVILADSPYDHVDPARYATVTTATRDKNGLTITVAVGPWPVVEDPTALAPPMKPHPTKPPYFVWRAPAAGLRPPRSDHEAREGWRGAVARLSDNEFYDESAFARLVRVLDPHGKEVRERSLEVGDTATAVLEVHTPGGEDPVHSVLVDTDPPGVAVGGIEKERVDGDHHLHVPIRALTAGHHRIDLSFTPEPLMSTRLSFTVEAHRTPTPSVGPPPIDLPAPRAGVATDAAHVRALAERLRRLDLDDAEWLTLLTDHVLPLASDDAVIRSITAEAAYARGEWDTVIRLLDDPGRFRTGDAFRALSAGLHYGLPTDVAGLLREIDLGAGITLERLAAELPTWPDAAVRQVAEVILDDHAGKEVLDRLLPPVYQRLPDDLALRVAAECAPADADAWLDRALRRWPDPHRMPDEAVAEILGWDVTDTRLTPYVREAIEDAVDAGDVAAVHELDDRARALLPRDDQVRLRAATARMFLDAEGTTATGRELLLSAVADAVGVGDPDLATELAFTARERWPAGEDTDVDAAVHRLRAVLADLADFQEWRDARDAITCNQLRPRTEGRLLHVVGGARQPWADQLATDLGLDKLDWHETPEGTELAGPALDWAAGIDDTELVVLIWTHTGRATAHGLDVAGVRWHPATWTRTGVLDAIRAAVSA